MISQTLHLVIYKMLRGKVSRNGEKCLKIFAQR